MSTINGKTKATVDGLLTDSDTTESEFKTGLTDVTTEVSSLKTFSNLVPVANGGTGANNADTARINLGIDDATVALTVALS